MSQHFYKIYDSHIDSCNVSMTVMQSGNYMTIAMAADDDYLINRLDILKLGEATNLQSAKIVYSETINKSSDTFMYDIKSDTSDYLVYVTSKKVVPVKYRVTEPCMININDQKIDLKPNMKIVFGKTGKAIKIEYDDYKSYELSDIDSGIISKMIADGLIIADS